MKPVDWEAADERDAWEALMDEECPACGHPIRDHDDGECPAPERVFAPSPDCDGCFGAGRMVGYDDPYGIESVAGPRALDRLAALVAAALVAIEDRGHGDHDHVGGRIDHVGLAPLAPGAVMVPTTMSVVVWVTYSEPVGRGPPPAPRSRGG